MTMPTTSAEDAARFLEATTLYGQPTLWVNPAWRTCLTFREPPLWAELVFHGAARVLLCTGAIEAGAEHPTTFEAQWCTLDDVAERLNTWVQQQALEGRE